MGSTPEELNTEIAGTRDALATDLDALQDRVSPQAIVERRKAAVRSGAQTLRTRVMGTDDESGLDSTGGGAVDVAQQRVQGSPIAAGMAAFFAGMLVSAVLPATETESQLTQKALDAAKEHGQPAVDELKSSGQAMASELKDSAQHAVSNVQDSAQESAERMRDESQASAETVRTQAQQ
jgi:hypothetical protein